MMTHCGDVLPADNQQTKAVEIYEKTEDEIEPKDSDIFEEVRRDFHFFRPTLWTVYEARKRELEDLILSSLEYESAIRCVTDELDI